MNMPNVKVFLYSNQAEYKKFYNQFLMIEDLSNSLMSSFSSEGFTQIKEMFEAHDGYAISIEADFEQGAEGEAFCLREVDKNDGIVALCGQRNGILNIAFPITPHALTEY